MFEGTLVRLATGKTRQTINICNSLNEPGFYRETYIILPPVSYLTVREFSGCKTVQALIELVERRGGFKAPPSTLKELEGRLVVLSTGTKSQTVNICRTSKRSRPFDAEHVIKQPGRFLTSEEFEACKTLGELINLVQGHGGVLRTGRDLAGEG